MKVLEEELKNIAVAENFDLVDISKLKGRIVSVSKTNHGSRYLKLFFRIFEKFSIEYFKK
jgi:hypothetical protein